MTPPPTPAELIALVEGSPAAVAAHDREAWLTLFSNSAQVCDPYGSKPASGRQSLERFYATFIAPNDITFEVAHDVVAGATVFRDLTLTTLMSGRVALRVPMHLRYDVVEESGSWRIERLHAHWELPSMVGQLLRGGLAGIVESSKLGPKLLRNQGIAGTLGFMRGFRRAGKVGKRTAVDLFTALRAGDEAGHLGAGVAVEFPGGNGVSDFSDLTWRKLLSAGNTVTASIGLGHARGVALVEFEHRRRRVSRVRFFLPSAG